jgi:hypothetical protein
MATAPADIAAPKPRGWPLFLLGVVVFLAGPVAAAVQMGVLGQTSMPWAFLGLTSAGVLLMALSLVIRFGILRTIGTAVFALVTGAAWFMVFVGAKTPEYTGPAQVGTPAPAFEVALADGRSFTNKDLADGNTIVLFYRGHW